VDKKHVNLLFMGHVDHGKSTLVGRTLFELGLVSEKDLPQEAGSFKFAWLMDRLKEERERGVTIELSYQKIETPNSVLTIIDAPGHRDFVKNMITGASQAEAAVLVVAADDGIMPQTREHAALAFTLGVNQLVVAINKMDLVGFDEKTYLRLKQEVSSLLRTLGYPSDFPCIPVSAWHGENLVRPSPKMPWYKGPTLLEALDALKEGEKPVDKPLRIPLQNVFSVTGVGTVPIGKVETGVLRVGDTVLFEPSGKRGEVRSIEMHHQPVEKALPGDNIGFNVRGVSKEEIRRGEVAGHPENPPTVAQSFTAKVVVLNVPYQLRPGFTPTIHCHTASVPGRIVSVLKRVDPRTGETLEENPQGLKKGEVGVVEVEPLKPLVIERVGEIPHLSRFAMRHAGQTVGAGVCVEVRRRE
jgi:elongation factor 1-alpha